MKPKVLITRQLKSDFLQILSQEFEVDIWPEEEVPIPRDELLRRSQGVVGILCMLTEKIDSELIAAAGPQLKCISTLSVGFDHIDCSALQEKSIRLGNTPDVLADSVADLTIALMIAAGRQLPKAEMAARDGRWQSWSPYWLAGQDLSKSVVGLVGMGSIAEQVVRRLRGFGCQIIYSNRSAKPELERKYNIKQVSLEELLGQSDFVSIHLPLTPDTKDMCGQSFFNQMKPSAVFVNTSRGGLVDQSALIRVLKQRKIWAAALDVTSPEPLPLDDPLFNLDNCIILPHVGSASIRTRDDMTKLAVNNLLAGIKAQDMPSEVRLG